MITEISATAFRQNLDDMLNIVRYRHESVLIKKDGKPVAALIDAKLFEGIRRMQGRFDTLCDRLARTYDGVPKTVALAEIDQAASLARRETADAWRTAGRLPVLAGTAAVAPTGGATQAVARAATRDRPASLRTRVKAKPTRRTTR